MSQGTGDEAFSDAGRSGDDDILFLSHPLASGHAHHASAIEISSVSIVEILHASRLSESCSSQPCLESFIVSLAFFAVDQQSEAFHEGELVHIVLGHLLSQCGGHSIKSELFEFVEYGML